MNSKLFKLAFSVVLICISLISNGHTTDISELKIENGQRSYNLALYSSFFLDKSSNLSLREIRSSHIEKKFRLLGKKPLNFGVIPDSACWLSFILSNQSNDKSEFVIELGTSTINTAIFFDLNPSGVYSSRISGDMHPMSTRDYSHRHINFSLKLKPGEKKKIYIRLKTEAIMETSLWIHSKEYFVAKLPVEYLLLGFFYAAFLVAILYNLFIYASLRDRNYLLYVLYASCFLCIWVFLDGLGQQFLWPDSPWQQVWGTRIANTLTVLFMVLFTSAFFNCRKNAPRLYKVFMAIGALCIFNTIMVCFLPLQDYKVPVRIAWVLAMPMVIFTAAVFWKRGFKRARYFLFAWILVLTGATIFFIDMYIGSIQSSFFTRYAWRIASVFEIIMLSLALADRINELNEQKNKAQEQTLEAETQLKNGLEEQVNLRTIELTNALAEVKQLSGMLPICSSCNKIRDDQGYWNRIESYIEKNSEAQFSHGMCPECMKKIYGKEDWFPKLKKKDKID